ncbi:MAG: hypothetical protein EA414_20475 [Arthrospira sp. PLM2.Bin9]|nr:hypothetical protein [Arthrospira sp. PLM2.Bin9]TVU51868.1 MAG: hypothetical protein EA414_20475 [Arthrospira sp. PLM2.Bin9]
MNNLPQFHSGQIVAIDAQNTSLYAEVIQVVMVRRVCWVRPLILVEFTTENQPICYHLRDSADLIWPLELFRVALDTEVIPFLVPLNTPEQKPEISPGNHQRFREFISQIWLNHSQVFQGVR